MANRKLFVSFTALLRKMRDDEVTEKELDRGLYYFGCTRGHAFDPASGGSNELTWIFKTTDEAIATHQVLLKYVEKAEADGRAIWRLPNTFGSYHQVNELLVKHGIEPLKGVDDTDTRTENPWYTYCYPGVRDRVEEQGLPLEVVF